ncbi:MAG: hypothetical protein JST54_20375 [Deltaproteobacteria bacterium]|nr:hypothetical protein [Deltaproteobacteria bacterium]
MHLRIQLGVGVTVLVVALAGCHHDTGRTDAGPGATDAGPVDAGPVDAGPVDAGPVDAGLDRWTAWSQFRDALRQSPDHLPAQADAAVQTRDATAIFEFVRDRIATYPPTAVDCSDADIAMRWGVRGTLRGGAGTPREKAELLVSLYQAAGFDAQVMVGTADPTKLDGRKMLLRTYDRTHAPPITASQAAAWAAALGHTTLQQLSPIDPTGSERDALAASLAAQVTGAAPAFDFTLGAVPLVQVTVNGTPTFANPLAADAAFGDPLTTDTPQPAADAEPNAQIHVLLQAARANSPDAPFTVMDRTFDAADVVGRQIRLQFRPPVDQASLLQMRPTDVEAVVPALYVTGADLSAADAARLATAGDLLTLGGDVYQQAGDGGLILNGAPIAVGSTDPAAIAQVSTVSSTIHSGAFPRITLDVAALDASGHGVPGLGAPAFTVTEDGQPVSFSVTQNQAPPPRVALIYDTSSSIPSAFLGASATDLANQVATALFGADAQAQFRVATMNFGVNWLSSDWAGTLSDAQAQAQLLATATGDSSIWEAVRDADLEGPTLIVLLSDGAAGDTRSADIDRVIAAGAPVLSIEVGTPTAATFDQLSALTGGSSVTASQVSDAVSATTAELTARALRDYTLAYQAPPSGNATRAVSVTVNTHAGAGSYTAPSTAAVANALSGLYLTIGVQGREHTAAIAGYASAAGVGPSAVTQDMLDDVRSLLLGGVTLQVEAAAPSPSVVLDDVVTEKLALRPLVDALVAQDDAAITAALGAGMSVTPIKLLLAQPVLPTPSSAAALTFETGPRVVGLVQKARVDGPMSQNLDIFPLSQWATASDDPAAAFQGTLQATAALAVMEAHMFTGTSTLEALQGVSLTAVQPGGAEAQAGLTDSERLAWEWLEEPFTPNYTLLVPLHPGAFWAVDTSTGTVIGVLPNGTGGGAEDVCADYNYDNSVAQIASLLGSFMGVSVGPWVALGQWEDKYVTMATLVIGYGGSAHGLSNPAASMACGGISDWLGNQGEGGQAFGAVDSITGTYNTVNPGGAQIPTLCGSVDGYDPCGG